MNKTSKQPQWSILAIMVMAVLSQKGYSATGPCDIYQSAGKPCVAAYSTVRALYQSYSGPLYQVRRSDNTTKDIKPLEAGGYVDASIQDNFCTVAGECRISIIYDQSSNGNHLTKAPAGNPTFGLYNDSEAVADILPIWIAGQKAYGVHITPGGWTTPGQVGYRNTNTHGIVKGDNPESIYMVTDGNYVNGACCFNFGNTEMDPKVYGDMESIYFGTNDWWDHGVGKGPWVMADLENGVYNMGGPGNYSKYGGVDTLGNKYNSQSVSFVYPFVTAYLKGNSAKATDGGPFTLKGGNSQQGALTTVWNGPFPVGYSPRNRPGGVALGVGGDNSSGAQGRFYEGVMTSGFASDATDDAIQANIVAAGYGSKALIVTVPAHRDTVFNGGFDQGSKGWTLNTWGSTAQGSVVNGEYKIDITALGTGNASIQLVQNGIILQQGKSYEVKFDAYASASRTLEANVEQDVSPWTSYLTALQNFDLTTTKKTYSYTFTMTNATDSNGRVSFNAGASTTGLVLDNISIKEVATPVSVSNMNAQNGFMSVHQNNSRLEVALHGAQGTSITMGLYSLVGKVVRASAPMTGNSLVSWNADLSSLPIGIYFVMVNADGRTIQKSKIVVGK